MTKFIQNNASNSTGNQGDYMNVYISNYDKDLIEKCLNIIRNSTLEDKKEVEDIVLKYQETGEHKVLYPLLDKFNLPVTLLSSGVTIMDGIIKSITGT